MKVEAGQLRQWKAEVAVLGDASGGSMFFVLEQHPDFGLAGGPFWQALRPVGDTKLWSESRIEGWSEVISEPR
jgi:hypothetical protein